MNEQITQFLTELRRQEKSGLTVEAYGSDLVSFARWFEATNSEPFKAASLTVTDLREFRGYLVTVRRARPATVNRRLAAIRKFCQWAKAEGLLDDLPTVNVKDIPSVKLGPKHLDKKQADRLTRAVERHGSKRDQAVIQVLRYTGIRVGELCDLRLGDLSLSDRKGSLTIREGKGGKWRAVPLNAEARRAIADYLTVRPRVSDDRLFIGQRGEGLHSQGVQVLIRKYARLADLDGVTPHALRHTCAKSLLDAGVDLVTVARILGHKSLDTTSLYLTPTAKDLELAMARLEPDYSLAG